MSKAFDKSIIVQTKYSHLSIVSYIRLDKLLIALSVDKPVRKQKKNKNKIKYGLRGICYKILEVQIAIIRRVTKVVWPKTTVCTPLVQQLRLTFFL